MSAYLTIDPRILGTFRILFGLLLLFDLGRRAVHLELLYSNEGILSNHYLLFRPQYKGQLSLFLAFSTPGEVALAFALTGVLFTMYLVGLYTRVVQVLTFVCFASLNSRNEFFEDGGTLVMVLLALWTAFLPLGRRYSIDAIRRDAALPAIRQRVAARAELQTPVRSLAVLAILLQALTIYVLNVVQKEGSTWRDGSAVHYVLWQNCMNTELANWLAFNEPGWFSPASVVGTLLVEAGIAVLIALPVKQAVARTAAFVLGVGLHGGIALLMTLGPFSYAMICLLWLLLPGSVLERLRAAVPTRWLARQRRLRARAVRWMRRARLAPRAPLPPSPVLLDARRGLHVARELTVVFLLNASALQLPVHNWAIKELWRVRPTGSIRRLNAAMSVVQKWSMFAPDPPLEDGFLVVDAVTLSGRHIDPFTGSAPDFTLNTVRPVPHSAIVCDYLLSIRDQAYEAYRSELGRYLTNWHRYEQRPESDRIVSYEVWSTSWKLPKPGQTAPTDFKRELILKYPP